MSTVRRYDAGAVGKAVRLPNGMLRCPATLTRVGVFVYRTADGGTRRELRLPEEVFKADALESFACVPVTMNHPDPRAHPEGVTAQNARELQVGQVGDSIRADGTNVVATVMLTDAAAIEQVNAGKVALSCGYEAETEDTPGEWHGQRYDAIQRNIRGNHVAIVDIARAGPEARLHLDGEQINDAGGLPAPAERTGSTMEKITIDGIELEVSKPAAQAFAKIQARADASEGRAVKAEAEVKTAKADADKAIARADAADKARTDAADPARVDALVAARVELLGQAREVLGSEFKADGLDAQGVKLAVIAKLDPEFKADGKSSDYVAAYFDAQLKARASKGAPIVRVDPNRQDAAPVDHRAIFNAAVYNGGKVPEPKK